MNAWKPGRAIAAAVLLVSSVAPLQPPTAVAESDPGAGSASASRWLLVCCGLPGDEPHRERLTAACEKILAAAEPVLDVAPQRVRVLAGDDAMREALGGAAGEVDVCTKDTVARAIAEMAEAVAADDACWIVLLGHAHLYDGRSSFNVAGPDFDQVDFAQWAEPLACREQVFWLTMPISGFWIKPLAGDSRLIVSATEADLEFTATEMPYALADVLSGEAEHQPLEDIDGDEAVSLLDLYLATNLEIHGRFQALERLQTEHAQLEDNGDGRGTEIQQPYLPSPQSDEDAGEDGDEEGEETAGEAAEAAADGDATEAVDGEAGGEVNESPPRRPVPIRNASLDGFRSRHIRIAVPPRTAEQ